MPLLVRSYIIPPSDNVQFEKKYMAKLKAGRLSREVADSCLQYWGGMGFTADNPIAQSYRDGRLISIGGGADEIMLGIICKFEGTLPGKA